MTENWKPIPGYEGYYEVSDLGRVKSLARVVPHPTVPAGEIPLRERILKQSPIRYPAVNLSRDGRQKNVKVHRLVAEVFVPNPEGYEVVDHLNGDTHDNRAANLDWCTREENIKRSWKAKPVRSKRRMKPDQVRAIRREYAEGETTYRELGEQYGLTLDMVGKIVRREAHAKVGP